MADSEMTDSKSTDIKMASSPAPPDEKIDENQVVKWSMEEVTDYVFTKIQTFWEDPKCNPFIYLNKSLTELKGDASTMYINSKKIKHSIDEMERDKQKFLRHTGALPKITDQKSIGVGVDLPFLPENIPLSVYNQLGSTKKTMVVRPFNRKEKNSDPIECIDLSSDDESSPSTEASKNSAATTSESTSSVSTASPSGNSDQPKHPALPPVSVDTNATDIPPKPAITITPNKNGATLQWDMPPEAKNMKIENFEIYAYNEKHNMLPSASQWEKIGTVPSMTLPMSCSLTQFGNESSYYFSVRAVNSNNKAGFFSDPASIVFYTDPKNL